MAVSTHVFNKDAPNPLVLAQDLMAQRQEQEQKQQALAQKQAQANRTQLSEMMEVGDDWGVTFRQPIMDKLKDFRGQIRQYARSGGQAENPDFQEWYWNNAGRIKSDAQKGKHVEKYIADQSEMMRKNTDYDYNIWEDDFLSQFQDENGQWHDPANIDLRKMKKAGLTMAGWNRPKVQKRWVTEELEPQITQLISSQPLDEQEKIIRRQEILTKLYVTDANGNIEYDGTVPKINVDEQVMALYTIDPERAQGLDLDTQALIKQHNSDIKPGTKEYEQLKLKVLEQQLRPWATQEIDEATPLVRSTGSSSTDYQGSGLRKNRYDNAMKFKEQVTAVQEGDHSYITQGGKVKKVNRKRGWDLVDDINSYDIEEIVGELDPETMYDVLLDKDGNVVDVIDYSDMDAAREKIGGFMRFQSRPTSAELEQTPDYLPEGATDEDYQSAGWMRFNPNKFQITQDERFERGVNETLAAVQAGEAETVNTALQGKTYKGKTVDRVEGAATVMPGKVVIYWTDGTSTRAGGGSGNLELIENLLRSTEKPGEAPAEAEAPEQPQQDPQAMPDLGGQTQPADSTITQPADTTGLEIPIQTQPTDSTKTKKKKTKLSKGSLNDL